MPAIRRWYVIVRLGLSTNSPTVTFTQSTDSMDKALELCKAEMLDRFAMNPRQYEFIECGIMEGF